MILSTLAILGGIAVFIYGGYDDSPGAQLLGILVIIVGIVMMAKKGNSKSNTSN